MTNVLFTLSFTWELLLLLAGGDKSTQSSDIRLALSLARLPRN